MRIVINDKYGGFGLSHDAIMRYAELKSIKLYAWVDDIAKRIYGENIKVEDAVLVHYATVPQKEYESIVEREREKPIAPGRFEKSNALYFSDRDIKRNDPLLIQVIKELKQEANGHCAKLKIINIPENVDWEVKEYDGWEHIAEKHRTWS